MKKSQQSIHIKVMVVLCQFPTSIKRRQAGKKNIVVLTTMHTSVSVTKDQRVKPNVHNFYHTKRGVDVVDLVSTHNTTKMKNWRWPIDALPFVLDTVRTNAKTILAESSNPATTSFFEFTCTLGKLLVLPNMQYRYQDLPTKCTKFWVFIQINHEIFQQQILVVAISVWKISLVLVIISLKGRN